MLKLTYAIFQFFHRGICAWADSETTCKGNLRLRSSLTGLESEYCIICLKKRRNSFGVNADLGK